LLSSIGKMSLLSSAESPFCTTKTVAAADRIRHGDDSRRLAGNSLRQQPRKNAAPTFFDRRRGASVHPLTRDRFHAVEILPRAETPRAYNSNICSEQDGRASGFAWLAREPKLMCGAKGRASLQRYQKNTTAFAGCHKKTRLKNRAQKPLPPPRLRTGPTEPCCAPSRSSFY
jgi:hypothetical protein